MSWPQVHAPLNIHKRNGPDYPYPFNCGKACIWLVSKAVNPGQTAKTGKRIFHLLEVQLVKPGKVRRRDLTPVEQQEYGNIARGIFLVLDYFLEATRQLLQQDTLLHLGSRAFLGGDHQSLLLQ